jgi:biotin carboxylase
VQSLNNGHCIRVFDHLGYSWVLIDTDIDASRNLQKLLAEIEAADAECAERIRQQLPQSWAVRASRLVSSEDDE